MNRGVNKWIGIGNCCADPEVRYMPSGGAVANVTIACNDEYKDKQTGENIDKTEFVRVVFFNRLAEIVGEYAKKGSKVYIEGKLQTRKWQDKATGADRYSTEIVANEMQLLDSRSAAGAPNGSSMSKGRQPSAQAANYRAQSQGGAQPGGFDNFDDDVAL